MSFLTLNQLHFLVALASRDWRLLTVSLTVDQSVDFHWLLNSQFVRSVPLGVSGYPTFTLIALCCFDAPVISQHAFALGHKVPILRITHRLLLFITSSAVYVIAWSRDRATQREHIRFTKFQIGDIVETLGATYRPETLCPFV